MLNYLLESFSSLPKNYIFNNKSVTNNIKVQSSASGKVPQLWSFVDLTSVGSIYFLEINFSRAFFIKASLSFTFLHF